MRLLAMSKMLRRLDRWAGRFNRWFGSAAVAAGAERSAPGGPPQMDPTSVAAVLGEIERERDGEEQTEPPGRD